jgi:hypothetical protein
MKTIPARDADPLVCPHCGEQVDYSADTMSNNCTLAENCTCNECGGRWQNVFKMTAQIIFEMDEPFPKDLED